MTLSIKGLAALALVLLASCNEVPTDPQSPPAVASAASSPAILLTYMCGNKFRLRNTYDTAAVVTYDVYKTSEQGTLTLPPKPAASPYSETFFTATNTGTVRVFANGILIQTKANGGKACTASANRRLISVVEAGVSGSPATRDTLYTSGATVAYNFSAATGYHDVLVTLDGQTVPSSGSVVMDTVHFLRASALLNVELPAGGEALLQSARAILTSGDPVVAFQNHLDEVLDSYQLLDEAEATRRLEAIYFLAFDPIQDSAALRRVDDALAGHVFNVYPRPGQPAGIRTIAVASSVSDPPEPTVYVYVNGIGTDERTTATSMEALFSLMLSASLLHSGTDSVKYFYNRTAVDQPQVMTPEEKAADCLHKLGPPADFPGEDDLYQRLFMLCLAQPLPGEPDILEAIRQYKRVYLGSGKFEVDADSLARRIQEWRNAGSHVIAVPHSEGNMMLQQAVTGLRNSGEFNTQRIPAVSGPCPSRPRRTRTGSSVPIISNM